MSYREVVIDGRITSAKICQDYEAKIKKYQAAAQGRIDNAQGKYKDPWAAAAYRRSHDWVRDPLAKRYRQSMTASATRALNTLSDGRAGTVDDLDDYLIDSLEACGLTKPNAKAEAVVQESIDLGTRIKTKAASKPWYPKGYSQYGTDLAWKWTDESCGYSYGYCWTIRIKAKDGCYGGVYAEMNIEKNGVVISYSNDTLGSLPAGRIGKMEFEYFNSGAGTLTGRLSELRCY